MSTQTFVDEIDCGSFFDHIDDFIDFPPVTDASLDSIECSDFNDNWANDSDEFKVADNVFIGSHSASALSQELHVPEVKIIVKNFNVKFDYVGGYCPARMAFKFCGRLVFWWGDDNEQGEYSGEKGIIDGSKLPVSDVKSCVGS
ncbi:hypothetical protein Tco_1348240 [Tanacetum coccineum]